MDEIETGPSKQPRRHLHSPETVTRATDASGDADLTRSHGQGNGVRIHGIYFIAVSLAALVLVVIAIVIVTTVV